MSFSSTERPTAANSHRNWILVAVGVGTFMSALDGSVVNTILPVIKQNFQSSISAVEWAVVVYLLVVSGLLLAFGRLGDLFGHKSFYLAGYVIFIAGSVLCGLASTAMALVFFRGLQAIGGAMLFSNSPAILTQTFPPQNRGRVLGLQGMMTYLGLMTGPALGGFLAQLFSWRAVFYINIPIGFSALLLSIVFIPNLPSEAKKEPFDIAGSLLFISGLVALMLGLNQGSNWGWASPAVLSLVIGSMLILAVFIYVERHTAAPMLDLSLFKTQLFSAGALAALLNYIALYSVIFLMPFYLIQGRGFNPASAGLLLTAQPLMMAIVTPLSGSFSDKVGSRVPATLGMAILAVGIMMLSWLNGSSPTAYIVISLAVAGLGVGLFVSPNNSAIMGSAPRQRQGIASGVLATARNVGMVLGVGLSGAILSTIASTANNSQLINPSLLYNATRVGFICATVIAILGCVVSAIRGTKVPRN